MGNPIFSILSELEKTLYEAGMNKRPEQTVSRLSMFANKRKVVGTNNVIQRIGGATTQKSNGLGDSIQGSSMPFDNRIVRTDRYISAIDVDELQLAQASANPADKEAFMRDMQTEMDRAFARREDIVIAKAALADVTTGKDMTTNLSFAADDGVTIDATGGINYSIIKQIFKTFQGNEVTIEGGNPFGWAMTDDENDYLLSITELINNNYVVSTDVTNNMMKSIQGMQMVMFGSNAEETILDVEGSVRDTIVMTAGAVQLDILADLEVEIIRLPETAGTYRILLKRTIGGTRLDGKKIIKVQTPA